MVYPSRTTDGVHSFYCAVIFFTFTLCQSAAYCAAPSVVLLIGESKDVQGKQRPVNPDDRKLLDYIERELGITFEVRKYPWARAELNAKGGEGLMLGLSKTAERLRHFRFSDAAYSNRLWLVTRSDTAFKFNSIEDLKGKTVGAVRGYHYGEEFERARNKIFSVDEDISTRVSRLKKLLLKRTDVVLLYQRASSSAQELEANINALMAQEMPPNVSFKVLPKPLQANNTLYFVVAKNKDDGMIDSINAALARRGKSGE